MTALGRHCLIDFFGCRRELLNAPQRLEALALLAARRSGATILSHHRQSFAPQGVTVVVILAESHLSLHTWPEHGYVAIDYFTCGVRCDPGIAIAVLEEVLRPSRKQVAEHARGSGLT
jgi:S-adenosylmethionine decarboxylase proenzyme